MTRTRSKGVNKKTREKRTLDICNFKSINLNRILLVVGKKKLKNINKNINIDITQKLNTLEYTKICCPIKPDRYLNI